MEAIVGTIRDTQGLKNVGTEDTFPVFKVIEEHLTPSDHSSIATTTAINDSFVLGHVDNGELGDDMLGNRHSAAVIQRIVNPNNTWKEGVRADTFKAAGTTADWDTTNYWWLLSVAAGSIIETKEIYLDVTNITNAKVIFDTDYLANAALNFDAAAGGNEFVDVVDAADLSFGDAAVDSAFSISAWIDMDDATDFPIISKYGNANNLREWRLFTDAADKLYFELYDASGAINIGRFYNTAITSYEGRWIHVAVTYDGSEASSGIKIYINGTQVDDQDSENGVYVAMHDTAQNVYIARYDATYGNGRIDEAAIWGKELSETEITDLYNSDYGLFIDKDENFPTAGGSMGTSLIALWHFDEGTAVSAADSSAQSHTGTLTNMEAADWVAGVVGDSSFTGLTIELTADGGANWETVSNDTLHVFANVGQDLRLKLTRTAGIFKIPIESQDEVTSLIKVEYNKGV